MKSLVSSRPRAAQAKTKKAKEKHDTGPLRQYRAWKVTTKGGNLVQQLEEANLRTAFRTVKDIPERCKAGHQLTVIAFEAHWEITLAEAKAILAQKKMTHCCSCEFASWAIEHGADVDQETTWLTETLREGGNGKKAAIALSDGAVYTFNAPDTLKPGLPQKPGKPRALGMMLLAISLNDAKHRRDK